MDDPDDDWLPRLSREPDDDAFLQRLGEALVEKHTPSNAPPSRRPGSNPRGAS